MFINVQCNNFDRCVLTNFCYWQLTNVSKYRLVKKNFLTNFKKFLMEILQVSLLKIWINTEWTKFKAIKERKDFLNYQNVRRSMHVTRRLGAKTINEKWPRKIPIDMEQEAHFFAGDAPRLSRDTRYNPEGGLNVTLKTSGSRFISHFHFLITVSAYRGPARPPLRFLRFHPLPSRELVLFSYRALARSPSLAPSFFLPLSGNNFTYRLHWSPYHCFISLQWRRGEWAGLPRPSLSGDLHERAGKIAALLLLLLLSCRSRGRLSEQQQQRSRPSRLCQLYLDFIIERDGRNIW